MRRLLLILPSVTYRAADFMTAARELGVAVTVASDRRSTLSRTMGERALTIPLADPEAAADAIVSRAHQTPFAAIVAADEPGVIVAALASERLGLPHNPAAAVAATRDKAALRRALERARVPQPRFAELPAGADVGDAVRAVGLPCVVKPLSLSGSRGVIRADTLEEARSASERARRIVADSGHGPGAALLLESYAPGAEVAVEGLLRHGRLEVLAVFDKPDPLEGPYFEETLYVTPSRMPAEALAGVEAVTQATAGALGLREGPVHAELRIDGGKATMLELAARSIGGLCSRTLSFGTGVSLEGVILRHALGLQIGNLRRRAAASGVMMLPIGTAGVLREVRGQDQARAVPGIVDLRITIPPGREVWPLPEGDRYLGFMFARGADPASVEAALREAHARLEVVIGTGTQTETARGCRGGAALH